MKHLLAAMLLLSVAVTAQQEGRLLRFPAIHGNQIVFTYAGDLYTVAATGGTARKLTNDIGFEMFPRFSADGQQIAFSGQYDGNTEVYLMPAQGGVPKRLTYTATLGRDDVSDRMGPNNLVMGWNGNSQIVYRSRWREPNDWKGQLYTVDAAGGPSQQLPLPRGGFCSYSPDGKQLAYNRVFREFRTWKRYRGGQADDIWIYDFATKTTENITSNPAQDIIPMWIGGTVYFISDRDSRMNLYSYNLTTKATAKLTSFTEFDCKFPSAGENAIVFENGGYIYRFDLATQKAEKVTIYLNDDEATGRGGWIDVSKSINSFETSPDGKRALFNARGDLFTVPVKNGPTRNITATPGVHERSPKWSPDGKWIAYISDESGEDEIYLRPQDGSGAPVRLTSNSSNYKYGLLWSPDSRKIAWNDRLQRLLYVDVETKAVTTVDQATQFEITSFSWSPDSRWMVYTRPEEEMMTTVYVYSLEQKSSRAVTDRWYASGDAAFSEDGKYLYVASQRNFAPTYGWTEWNHIYQDMEKLYLIALTKDTRSPFEPKSDEVAIKDTDAKKDADKKSEDKKDKSGVSVTIDFDGITDRVAEIPVRGASYFNLAAAEGKLYYQRRASDDNSTRLFMYDFEKLKETDLGDIDGYELSADKKKMLVNAQGAYYIIDAPVSKPELREKLNLSDLKVNLDRKAEWAQIFTEAWRQMRDFFFAPNMHGVDWKKVHDTYKPLVSHVNHRADLTYIIGEMIGELNAGHAYVGGGDYPKADRIPMGLLGAQLSRDKSGYFRIDKIYRGQNWDKSLRSPLTDIGVTAKEGEYITAVNGISTATVPDIYQLLAGTAGKQVRLQLNSAPKETGSRMETVIPTDNEQGLIYFNWVQGNIDKVNKATGGKVGYIHIPDMGVNGLNQFVKYYYPQLKKEALIIDDRGNGGGNVSPQIIERLRRELAMFDVARNTAIGYNPGGMHYGPKIALIDEFSASDGDIFAYRFRHYKLGTIVGKRSWGGVVGIRGTLPFVDGGFLNRPEFSRFDIAGKEWIMEGHGVDPDVVVDNDPALEFAGTDQQLDKAIALILAELKANPRTLPQVPAYPDKSK